jgi:hypothetical protein
MARSTISAASAILLVSLYHNTPQPEPQNFKVRKRDERNQAIRQRFAEGEDASSLAVGYGISLMRIYQIIHGRRK